MAENTAKSVGWSSRRQAEGRRLRQLLAAVPLTFAIFLLLVNVVLPCFQHPTPSSETLHGAFHSRNVFKLNYAEMERQFKVYVYPDENPITDEYTSANVMNTTYDSQGYFLMNLMNSSFRTHDPDEAHLFFIPVKPQVRNLKDILLGGRIVEMKAKYPSVDYVEGLIAKYPYWNRTLGADHFFVSCQNIGLRETQEKHPLLAKNSIRVLCFSDYDLGFISNYKRKDVVLPEHTPPLPPQARNDLAERNILGYCLFPGLTSQFGRFRSPRCIITEEDAKETFVDVTIDALIGASPFEEQYQKSKFCIFRLDSHSWRGHLPYIIASGCVPVIVSDNQHLPFSDVLDWSKFSVIVKGRNVYRLRNIQLIHHIQGILKNIPPVEYEKLYKNLLKVKKHFEWNIPAVRYDAFHMVMYELWLRHYMVSRFYSRRRMWIEK